MKGYKWMCTLIDLFLKKMQCILGFKVSQSIHSSGSAINLQCWMLHVMHRWIYYLFTCKRKISPIPVLGSHHGITSNLSTSDTNIFRDFRSVPIAQSRSVMAGSVVFITRLIAIWTIIYGSSTRY